MSNQQTQTAVKRSTLSLDTWAVFFGMGLVALVRLGLLKHITW